jgi:AraC-like DNA-binding protein
MPFAAAAVPKPIPAATGGFLPEAEFDATLWRLPEARAATMHLPRDPACSVASVRWPADGGHITQLRSMPWEGATAHFFDFRMNEPLQVCLHRTDELLLTFFLTGEVRGRYGNDPDRPLDFRIGRALLRTPNRHGGYHIHIPAGHRNAFVQFRLKQRSVPLWLTTLGVKLGARHVEELAGLDDGTILCNAVPTPRVQEALSRIAALSPEQPASLPLFHAYGMELLTLALLDLQDLLRPGRSVAPGVSKADGALRIAKACVKRDPAAAWTVASLAAAAGTSTARLQQAFREGEGVTAYQFVRNFRLDMAARLLRQTRHAVEEIAAQTGWDSHGRFGAAFRGRFGCTPSAYRAGGVRPPIEGDRPAH